MTGPFRVLISSVLLTASLLASSQGFGQTIVTGQLSAGYIQPPREHSSLLEIEHHPGFIGDVYLFADAAITENVIIRGTVRLTQSQTVMIEAFNLNLFNIFSEHINLQAGMIDVPFLSLGTRRYPWQNPFYDLPLMNEHHTHLLPVSASSSTGYYGSSADDHEGIYLLSHGLYDVGMKMFGDVGRLNYAIALTNGTLAFASLYGSAGLNANQNLALTTRVGYPFAEWLDIGVSFSRGDVDSPVEPDGTTLVGYMANREITQNAFGLDITAGIGHLTTYMQALYSIFKQVSGIDLNSTSYSFEAAYAITPRFSCAARIGGMYFDSADGFYFTNGQKWYANTWDMDLTRIDGSLRYRINRSSLVKGVYRRHFFSRSAVGGHDDTYILQLVVTF